MLEQHHRELAAEHGRQDDRLAHQAQHAAELAAGGFEQGVAVVDLSRGLRLDRALGHVEDDPVTQHTDGAAPAPADDDVERDGALAELIEGVYPAVAGDRVVGIPRDVARRRVEEDVDHVEARPAQRVRGEQEDVGRGGHVDLIGEVAEQHVVEAAEQAQIEIGERALARLRAAPVDELVDQLDQFRRGLA